MEIFGAYGEISDIDVPLNRQCEFPVRLEGTLADVIVMTNRGTAYITYTSAADAKTAIAHMHESQLDGVKIGVSIVVPRRKASIPSPRRGSAARGRYGRYTSPRGYGRGGGMGGRGRNLDTYRPRSVSRSKSPRRHRTRSVSSSRSRSRSRSPPRRGGRREYAEKGRKRSRSYSSYSSYDRSRSRSRSPVRERRR
jgi:RNA-binding protein with serine-rich domain 1